MTAILYRNCPLCDGDNSGFSALRYSPREWPLKRCVRCAFVYLERAPVHTEREEKPSLRRTARETLKQKVSGRVEKNRLDVFERRKLGTLIRAYIPPGSVADIGCSDRNSLQSLAECHTPIGLEISAKFAGQAQRQVAERGCRLIAADALMGLQTLADGELAGAIISALLNHETQPRRLLTEVRRALAPQGRIIVKTPNFASWNRVLFGTRWCGFRFPDRLNYFTPLTLARLARETRFRVFRCHWWDRMPTSDDLWMVLEKENSTPPVCRSEHASLFARNLPDSPAGN